MPKPNLGLCITSEGVAQDYQEARISVAAEHDRAQIKLGFMYYNGEGVAQDYQETLKWYQLAAEQGNDRAQTKLGFMYYNGSY